MSPFPLALLGGMSFLEFCLAYYEKSGPRAVFWTQAVFGIVFFVLLLLMYEFTVRVDEKHVSFGFGPFRKTLSLSKIAAAYHDEASLMKTGVGVHIVGGGYWAWVARPGAAVRIVMATGSRTPGYIVSTSRPRDLIAALTTGPVVPVNHAHGSGRSGAAS